ncbi:MAG: protein-export membrane protein SecF [Patescibacteria group bacterium]|nr:MAG: protein-export membrane protein SecF [Patescibacteria group bacterium]
MIDFVKNRKIYFLISCLILLPGVISLLVRGMNLGIDFSGGARFEIGGPQISQASPDDLRNHLAETTQLSSIQRSGDGTWIMRSRNLSQQDIDQIVTTLNQKYPETQLLRFENVGPTIGAELGRNALIALAISWIAIILYVAYSFRSVPKPLTSWQFGITAIIALIHDALFVIGLFSILGWTLNVEVDALFVTALLTIMGFSVHDTIVVYDRIRENLIKKKGKTIEETVNIALNETLVRSLNTSGTVAVVLIALVIFGGESIRWFTVALLAGIVSGAYSSVFLAAQLLVVWHHYQSRQKIRQNMLRVDTE